MSYYVEHGPHYINVSEYRIALYFKMFKQCRYFFKVCEQACMYVCVRVFLDACVLFCRLYTHTYAIA